MEVSFLGSTGAPWGTSISRLLCCTPNPNRFPAPNQGAKRVGRCRLRRAGRNPAATLRSAARRRPNPVSGCPDWRSRLPAAPRAGGRELRLPGALRLSLVSAKSPRDGCGQLINSMGSELDISWLLSLCLIVSAGGGRGVGSRGYAGDGEVDKKGAGGPTELAFIAFAVALWLARPAWFPQGRPPCRRAGCPAVWSTLGHLGCARGRFKGGEGGRSPSRGQRTYVAQPKGSPVGAQLGGGFISRLWRRGGGDLSKAGARGARGPATLRFS